jgi:cation transport regulator ChaB
MTDQRARLAQAQAELLAALLADGPTPAGFDEQRLRVEANSLLAKRRGIVAMLNPDVADELGERFRPLFTQYARAHPRRSGSRAREDAADFVAWARARGALATPKRRWWQRKAT